MNNYLLRVKKIVETNRYLSMATCSDNEAWVAPLSYVLQDGFHFVFYSALNSLHSQHIASNNTVACTIFNSSLPSDEVDGIQFLGQVTQIKEEDLLVIMDNYFRKSFPDPDVRKNWQRPESDFKEPNIQRFYKITPLKLYIIDLESSKVDKRIQIDLTDLNSIFTQG